MRIRSARSLDMLLAAIEKAIADTSDRLGLDPADWLDELLTSLPKFGSWGHGDPPRDAMSWDSGPRYLRFSPPIGSPATWWTGGFDICTKPPEAAETWRILEQILRLGQKWGHVYDWHVVAGIARAMHDRERDAGVVNAEHALAQAPTALMCAAAMTERPGDVVRLLIAGEDPEALDRAGRNALHLAAQSCAPDSILAILIDREPGITRQMCGMGLRPCDLMDPEDPRHALLDRRTGLARILRQTGGTPWKKIKEKIDESSTRT